jgi:hypothetical protein
VYLRTANLEVGDSFHFPTRIWAGRAHFEL